MKRQLYSKLTAWKTGERRKPLLLQGARQVGKTWLLKQFGNNEYESISYFNFEQNPELSSLFQSSLSPELLIDSLSAFSGKAIFPEKTLIFFDEIQACPRAITSLKYFCEDAPEYHIVAAGSLLGVSVGKKSNFPVGKVTFMTLYPMSFFEYLEAFNEGLMIKHLKKNGFEKIPEAIHEKLNRILKYYLYTGGMPEVVQSYIEHKNIETVRKIQSEILEAYKRDFSKYTTNSEAIHISDIWNSIPSQLAKENKKFKYNLVKKNGRASRFMHAIEWLRKAGLINIINNISTPKLPLAGYANPNKFKVYLLDTGLLGAMLNISSKTIVTGDALFTEYYGTFIENYVSSALMQQDIDLFYWTSESEAEVDFIIQYNDRILPLEVKSGLTRRMKSLRVYADKYSPVFIYRTSKRNFTQDNDFKNIPLYAVSLFPELS